MFDPKKPFFIRNDDGDEWHDGMRVVCKDHQDLEGNVSAVILVRNAYSGGEDFVLIDMDTSRGYWLINDELCRAIQED